MSKCGKKIYPSQNAAEWNMVTMWKRRLSKGERLREVRSYACRYCGGWHLTSRP